jgi:hypothetical protein
MKVYALFTNHPEYESNELDGIAATFEGAQRLFPKAEEWRKSIVEDEWTGYVGGKRVGAWIREIEVHP